MAYLADTLRSAIGSIATRMGLMGGTSLGGTGFEHQLALAAYMSSGMLRKVIAIPAADRTQKWRDWQADKETIKLIETEEKRLGLQAKTKAAEILRGVGGGALLLITNGDHASELKPETIAKGGLVAVNLVSRWQIQGQDWVKDLADPAYGTPRKFTIDGSGARKDIHPSRVICFRGEPLPAGSAVSEEEAFWGDSKLLRVFTEVQRSDDTQAWFSALVKKAKLLRVGIPNLTDFSSSEEGQKKLNSRVALIAEGESALNATVYDAGNGTENAGEKITDYQITWAGIPAVMDAFDQRVSAVADIPFTRLMGRSPAGMNATGEHDTDNWNDSVSDGQENETRPCLEGLDPILLRSAGVAKPDDVTWKWAPLWTPTEQEEATTFDKFMDAIGKVQNTGSIPDRAFAEAFQNFLEEREYLPGLAAALAKVPEDERFPEPEPEPDEFEEGGDPASGGEGGAAVPSRRAANDWFADATPRPLYVQRKLLNAADVITWAKSQGFTTTLPADDMHVTVLYSRTPVDPMKMGETWASEENGGLKVKPGGPRAVELLGENAVVLLFASWPLSSRHSEMVEAGGSHDFPEYQPHVTVSYDLPEGLDLDAIKPFTGELRFGPEIFEPLDLDWKSKVDEK